MKNVCTQKLAPLKNTPALSKSEIHVLYSGGKQKTNIFTAVS